jgi:glyoxylase-like metal-dependent hydrolase (beta-lactamase superfamily II)
VLVTGFPAAAFGTNCYVLAPGQGQECLVVDPGVDVVGQLESVLAELRLRPAAVLLTHGHFDHTYSVTPVCGAHGIAAYVHRDDRYRLDDPLAGMDRSLLRMLEQQFGAGATWTEPDDVRVLADGDVLELAGLKLTVVHAPGHTEGSVMFTLPQPPEGTDAGSTVISGDVLFAGSIGRTDLPGGSHPAMMRSLREKVLTLPDDALVLPGHGSLTTIARERASNPYLAEVANEA